MKLLIASLLIATSALARAEVIMKDLHTYKPGERKAFTLNWTNALQLCVKIPAADHRSLRKQCSKRGGCLRLSDKTNHRSYGYDRHIITVDYDSIKGGKLNFAVSNEYDGPHDIAVTAFNPNLVVDESFKLPSGKTKTFKVKSARSLAVFARIPVRNVNPLVKACEPKSNCLKIEFYDENLKSWSWAASTSGVGKTLSPDKNGEIAFRVVNEYPMAIDVQATAGDIKPASCEW